VKRSWLSRQRPPAAEIVSGGNNIAFQTHHPYVLAMVWRSKYHVRAGLRSAGSWLCLSVLGLLLIQSAFVRGPQESARFADASETVVQAYNNGPDHQQSIQDQGSAFHCVCLAHLGDLPTDRPLPITNVTAPRFIPPSLNSLLLYTQTTSTHL
jgi:hypothetical protein